MLKASLLHIDEEAFADAFAPKSILVEHSSRTRSHTAPT
jgi:hypothetical protein